MADPKKDNLKTVKDGTIVDFTPNPNTLNHKFSRAKANKKTFPAIVVETNDKSVDLQVFNKSEIVYMANIPHVSQKVNESESSWEFQPEEK